MSDMELLTRKAAATMLTDIGLPITCATLTTMATRGGGPPYRLFGKYAIYDRGELLTWAESKLKTPVVQYGLR